MQRPDVKAMDLPTSFDGLRIVRDDEQYALAGSDWAGRAVAGACFEVEDSGVRWFVRFAAPRRSPRGGYE